MLEDLCRLLSSGNVQAHGVVDTMTQQIVVLNQNLHVITANNAFIKTFRFERDDILDKSLFSLRDGQWNIPELRHLIAVVIPRAVAVIGFEVKYDFPSIGPRTFLIDARRLVQSDDNSSNILVLFDDITERQHQTAEIEFIISETRHRMKNLFSVVRAIAMQTEVKNITAAEFRQVLLGRLETTFRAQELAATNETANFDLLVKQSVSEQALNRIRCAVDLSHFDSVSLNMLIVIKEKV
ncbi:PAS domain-containing protein, partial [Brucella sp. 21LCYQ03]|nr:PAS domain-containing protein [Brucella sp. 21LCYQ03]